MNTTGTGTRPPGTGPSPCGDTTDQRRTGHSHAHDDDNAHHRHHDQPQPSTPGTPPGAPAPATAVWELAAGPAAASRARDLTRRALRDWRVTDPGDGDAIVLIVDELVTNAVVHGAGPVRLTLRLHGPREPRRLTGEVHDHGTGALPDPAVHTGATALDWSEDGRGLLLVAALATDHGARPGPCGTTVWFTRALAPA